MLPVVDRPLIQHVVDEAREAGIEHFIFVTGRNKAVIEDHFDRHLVDIGFQEFQKGLAFGIMSEWPILRSDDVARAPDRVAEASRGLLAGEARLAGNRQVAFEMLEIGKSAAVGATDWHEIQEHRFANVIRRLWDEYAFPGFRPLPTVRGVFGDPKACVITLKRRSKKRSAVAVVECTRAGTTDAHGAFAICRVATRASFWRSRCVGCCARVAGT